jgi:starch synthase
MVCSETEPFASTGGLADVLGALPKALAEAGQEVAVLLPLYRQAAVPNARVVYERLQFGMGSHGYCADILEQLEYGVRYVFVRLPELYDREGLYGENLSQYSDNHLRFGALCYAALGVARYLFAPDLLHCHDWQAGLLPVLVREIYQSHPAYLGLKTVFTIHNLPYQGVFPEGVLADMGLPSQLAGPELLGFQNGISFLKGALVCADILTTVSPRYGEEIQTPHYGCGLDGVLRARSHDLVGILNGADYELWNPARDPYLAQPFDRGNLKGKTVCKRALLAEFGLLPQERFEKPLIGIVSRFAGQKGFDLLMQIPHELAAEDVSLVVLGHGEQSIEDFFRWFASAYPDRVAARIGYEDEYAHRILAGSDMLLMPSRYEPCGLNQMYGMRYGTLPLVRATGGLDDTVDADTGFKFWGETAQEMLGCVRAALEVFGTPRWAEMVDAAMQRRFSWDASARKYIRLYRQLTS